MMYSQPNFDVKLLVCDSIISHAGSTSCFHCMCAEAISWLDCSIWPGGGYSKPGKTSRETTYQIFLAFNEYLAFFRKHYIYSPYAETRRIRVSMEHFEGKLFTCLFPSVLLSHFIFSGLKRPLSMDAKRWFFWFLWFNSVFLLFSI